MSRERSHNGNRPIGRGSWVHNKAVDERDGLDRIFQARDLLVSEGYAPADALQILIEQALVQRRPLVNVAESVLAARALPAELVPWHLGVDRFTLARSESAAVRRNAEVVRAENARIRAQSAALLRSKRQDSALGYLSTRRS